MTYQSPELFELGKVEDLTFGGCGCWSDHDTHDGEEASSLIGSLIICRLAEEE